MVLSHRLLSNVTFSITSVFIEPYWEFPYHHVQNTVNKEVLMISHIAGIFLECYSRNSKEVAKSWSNLEYFVCREGNL